MKDALEKVLVLAAGGVSACYLLNIGAGVIEFIPDNFPILGNLDEAAATTVLLGTFAYFGVDISRVFSEMRRKGKESTEKTGKEFIDV